MNFTIALGMAFLFTGLLCFFFDVSNVVMMGIAISAALFNIIAFMHDRFSGDKKNERLLRLLELSSGSPIFLILVTAIFRDQIYLSFKEIDRTANAFTFLSLGYFFISIEYNKIKRAKDDKYAAKKSVENELNNARKILDKAISLNTKMTNIVCNADDLEKSELINKLNNVLIESSEDNMLLLELIGSDKEKYSFDDVNECIKKTRDKQAKIRKKIDDVIKSKNN